MTMNILVMTDLSTPPTSPFSGIPPSEWVASNELAFAILDRYPVCPGHTLIVPRRLVTTYFEASAAEKVALWALVDEVKVALDHQLHPDGYNVGFNAGEAAGQTVLHLHIHVIPRFRGDVADPRGGVRHVIPVRANYLLLQDERRAPLATGGDRDPFGRHLWPLFADATEVAIVAAFVTETGLAILEERVFAALRSGARIRIVTGDYLAFNQVEALRQLLGWSQLRVLGEGDPRDAGAGGRLGVRVVETALEDGAERAFHPKSWLFQSSTSGVAFVGSSNLSRSAPEVGVEWNLRVERSIDPTAYASVRDAIDRLWATAIDLTADRIDAYEQRTRERPRALPPGEGDAERLEPPPSPHEIQEEALVALAQARGQGRRRALVVLGTGMGKTWLAAFDVARLAATTGKWPRVLFLAHRE
jgi:diadenosine tetraphosphate (Ap4A) HIT family hydrolase